MAKPVRKDETYRFRAVEDEDLPLLESWLGQPHWTQWWGSPTVALAEIRAAMESIDTEPLIVELNGRPIAYLQSYDPHLEDDHPYADQPFGTLGVDLSIGPVEMLGKGHGSAMLRQFTEQLFAEGAPRVVIDPDPANLRAIRAYTKAGFRSIEERDTASERVLLMARDDEQVDIA
jgi:aminoglycoside 6'-N-acetyltransferase